jgi:hypothetical protein
LQRLQLAWQAEVRRIDAAEQLVAEHRIVADELLQLDRAVVRILYGGEQAQHVQSARLQRVGRVLRRRFEQVRPFEGVEAKIHAGAVFGVVLEAGRHDGRVRGTEPGDAPLQRRIVMAARVDADMARQLREFVEACGRSFGQTVGPHEVVDHHRHAARRHPAQYRVGVVADSKVHVDPRPEAIVEAQQFGLPAQ